VILLIRRLASINAASSLHALVLTGKRILSAFRCNPRLNGTGNYFGGTGISFDATGNFQGGAGKLILGGRHETSVFFGVDGVLRRHQVLRKHNRRRRLYLNE
jgi:hypothetical protein